MLHTLHQTELESFDRSVRQQVEVRRPETLRSLEQVIRESPKAIARGAGLSYSAASFGADAVTLDMTKFDRVLAFDEESGLVTVEPGIRIGSLTEFLLSRGRYLPALPGYPAITVGGCVAFDVHGKSQAHSGNFEQWVESFVLHHRDHGRLECSRDVETSLFELTLGGMGLTGVLTRVRLRTAPAPSSTIELEVRPVNNLVHAAEVLQSAAPDAACLYSWNNLNLRGARFGRGAAYVERFVPSEATHSTSLLERNASKSLPLCIWGHFGTRLALGVYGAMQRPCKVELDLQRALFPIYGKEAYYAGFGPNGFREYQVIVPFDRWPQFALALQQQLDTAGVPVTLGSLKVFRGEAGFLRFSGTGICLALDVPASSRSRALFEALDELAICHHALVNLSKDSRLSKGTCQRVFPHYSAFRAALDRFDPNRRYGSQLSQQLGL
jgi:decaprenylphospho-beta-D-ribofuranose 2-oxidase